MTKKSKARHTCTCKHTNIKHQTNMTTTDTKIVRDVTEFESVCSASPGSLIVTCCKIRDFDADNDLMVVVFDCMTDILHVFGMPHVMEGGEGVISAACMRPSDANGGKHVPDLGEDDDVLWSLVAVLVESD